MVRDIEGPESGPSEIPTGAMRRAGRACIYTAALRGGRLRCVVNDDIIAFVFEPLRNDGVRGSA